MPYEVVILGIESSCDDTSAAIIADGIKLSNVTAGQSVHESFGGVVPELASRAHQQNIIPVVHEAFKQAGISPSDVDAVAYTNGPGLLGSLLVGSSFAKGFALGQNIPLITVNHMQAHVLAHFIQEKDQSVEVPPFPFLCLTVSGGHTQIVKVNDYFTFELLGQTRDDAAGEAFDKIAKIMGLPYPGGPVIDRLAQEGNPKAFKFPKAQMPDLDYSFSGLKTAVLNRLKKEKAQDPDFIETNKADIAASVQHVIIDTLMDKLNRAIKQTGIKHVALAGGVSANSGLRKAIQALEDRDITTYIPPFEYCTDNAGMIGIVGYYKYLQGEFSSNKLAPQARMSVSL